MQAKLEGIRPIQSVTVQDPFFGLAVFRVTRGIDPAKGHISLTFDRPPVKAPRRNQPEERISGN